MAEAPHRQRPVGVTVAGFPSTLGKAAWLEQAVWLEQAAERLFLPGQARTNPTQPRAEPAVWPIIWRVQAEPTIQPAMAASVAPSSSRPDRADRNQVVPRPDRAALAARRLCARALEVRVTVPELAWVVLAGR